jgi:hypothetical protein
LAATLRRDVRVLQGLEFIAQNGILPVPSRSGFQSALIQELDDTPHLRAFPNFIEGEAQTRLELLLVSHLHGKRLDHGGRRSDNGPGLCQFNGFGVALGFHVGMHRTFGAAMGPERVVRAVTEKWNRGSVDVTEVGFRTVPHSRRGSSGNRYEQGGTVVNQPGARFLFTQPGVPGPGRQVLRDVLALRRRLTGGEARQVKAVLDQIPNARVQRVLASAAQQRVQHVQKRSSFIQHVCPRKRRSSLLTQR